MQQTHNEKRFNQEYSSVLPELEAEKEKQYE